MHLSSYAVYKQMLGPGFCQHKSKYLGDGIPNTKSGVPSAALPCLKPAPNSYRIANCELHNNLDWKSPTATSPMSHIYIQHMLHLIICE